MPGHLDANSGVMVDRPSAREPRSHPNGKRTMLTQILVIACLLTGEPANDEALKAEVHKLVLQTDADTKEHTHEGRRPFD